MKLKLPAENKLISLALALITVGFVVVLYYAQTQTLESFEAKTYDLRFKALRGPVPPSQDIAIIAINEKSIAELGRYPWSRKYFAELVDAAGAAGAKAILLDMFFPEPESPEIDQKFAAALRRAGNVTLAMAFDFAKDWSIKGRTGNLPILREAARNIGHINVVPDEDGVNRRTMLLVPFQGELQPSLALRGAMAAMGVDKVERRPFSIIVGDRRVPTDFYHTMLINYCGPPGTYPMYGFSDVIKGRIDPKKLRNKVIFVGMTALGIYDMRVTPFHSNTPGVEINATIADNIIRGNFIQRSGIESLIDLFFVVFLGLLAFFIAAKLKPSTAFPLLPVMAGGYIWFAYYMFLAGHWLSFVYPLTSLFLAYIVSLGFRFVIIERRAREIRSIFSSYVPPKIVDQLVNNPDKAKIGGDCREITVMFIDIKGFTSFSESLSPLEVVTALNQYLAVMTSAVFDHEGTVDKFLGDGLMAYWGAPLAQDNHAEAAVSCTFAIKNAIAGLRKKNKGLPTLSFRTGINSGEVIAGNIGARGKKMEYTVIGDTVNLASRLESTAKFYGVDILVSESTYRETRDIFLYRELDRLRVVGKTIPITIYELLGAQKKPPPEFNDLACSFAEALTCYRCQNWPEADDRFTELCGKYPEDKPSLLYRDRCAFFRDNPPPPDWDGVFNRKEK